MTGSLAKAVHLPQLGAICGHAERHSSFLMQAIIEILGLVIKTSIPMNAHLLQKVLGVSFHCSWREASFLFCLGVVVFVVFFFFVCFFGFLCLVLFGFVQTCNFI